MGNLGYELETLIICKHLESSFIWTLMILNFIIWQPKKKAYMYSHIYKENPHLKHEVNSINCNIIPIHKQFLQ